MRQIQDPGSSQSLTVFIIHYKYFFLMFFLCFCFFRVNFEPISYLQFIIYTFNTHKLLTNKDNTLCISKYLKSFNKSMVHDQDNVHYHYTLGANPLYSSPPPPCFYVQLWGKDVHSVRYFSTTSRIYVCWVWLSFPLLGIIFLRVQGLLNPC